MTKVRLTNLYAAPIRRGRCTYCRLTNARAGPVYSIGEYLRGKYVKHATVCLSNGCLTRYLADLDPTRTFLVIARSGFALDRHAQDVLSSVLE